MKARAFLKLCYNSAFQSVSCNYAIKSIFIALHRGQPFREDDEEFWGGKLVSDVKTYVKIEALN